MSNDNNEPQTEIQRLMEAKDIIDGSKTISLRPVEVVARYDIEKTNETADDMNEIAIFRHKPQTIPFFDGQMRLEGSEKTLFNIDTEHYIKCESGALPHPLYIKISTKERYVHTTNQSRVYPKYEKIIGEQRNCIFTPDLKMGTPLDGVFIRDGVIKVPKTQLGITVEREEPGLLERIFKSQPVNTPPEYMEYEYQTVIPNDCVTVYHVNDPIDKHDEILTVTVDICHENSKCTFVDVKTGDEYPVDLTDGRLGNDLKKFFDEVGRENLDGEFRVKKTHFERGNAINPSKSSKDTKTYAVWLLPYTRN